MSDYYRRDGSPMDMMDWAVSLGDNEYKRIDKDTVGDADVSTVWLGLDHGWGGGAPVIFETMIFGGEHDQFQDRYTTEEEAVAGHARVVEALRRGDSPDQEDTE